MKAESKGPDWIRLFISLFLGTLLTGLVVLIRIEWFYYTPYKVGRYFGIVILWVCFSVLIWLKTTRTGDPP